MWGQERVLKMMTMKIGHRQQAYVFIKSMSILAGDDMKKSERDKL
jgi:hypothetical protein